MVHLLLVIAFVLVIVGFAQMFPYLRARNWISSTATVISITEQWSNVRYSVYWRLKYFYPIVEYGYQFGDRSYNSSRVSFEKQNVWVSEVDSFGMPIGDGKKFWARWSKGITIPIYVNPNDPRESVIVKELDKKRRSHHLALIVGGGLIIVVWALLIFST